MKKKNITLLIIGILLIGISILIMFSNSNKKIAIISDDYWEKVKQEYINDLRNGIKYEVEEEPRAVYEELKNDDIITSSAVSLFGDIVEID